MGLFSINQPCIVHVWATEWRQICCSYAVSIAIPATSTRLFCCLEFWAVAVKGKFLRLQGFARVAICWRTQTSPAVRSNINSRFTHLFDKWADDNTAASTKQKQRERENRDNISSVSVASTLTNYSQWKLCHIISLRFWAPGSKKLHPGLSGGILAMYCNWKPFESPCCSTLPCPMQHLYNQHSAALQQGLWRSTNAVSLLQSQLDGFTCPTGDGVRSLPSVRPVHRHSQITLQKKPLRPTATALKPYVSTAITACSKCSPRFDRLLLSLLQERHIHGKYCM